ncbi:YqeG family HAD IIIA-type phosphatase [Eubacteriales bacterium OttesenSCG-928-G02]|nr:YqeG family HAD IIIA-type phosphatase [Eubacteriales bacterium OttesenSCG-928-G02]
MKKRDLFVPEGIYTNIYEITAELLTSLGKKGAIFDIDNTVAPYETAQPTEKMKEYFASLADMGITMAFVSNNKGSRASIFNKELGFFCIAGASKPSTKGIKKCLTHMKLSKEEVVVVGDQIFTDCLAAHRTDVDFFMVKPINDKETVFFKLKRLLEKPSISLFYKKRRTQNFEK